MQCSVGHFEVLLESIVANPAKPIAELQILTEDERRLLLYDFNGMRTEYPRDATVGQLFEEQAARSPDSLAATFDGEQITYGQLNEKANRLARYLREHGVGPESVVGVLMDRSLEAVVAVLGVLKAGGAYLPLDPSHPRERLAFMLEDSGARLLLAQERFRNVLSSESVATLFLDKQWEMLSGYGVENLQASSAAQNLAYVMYTSGSTGRPKGVCVLHQAINRLVFNTDYIALSPGDRVAHLSNFSFDAATFEIWGALLTGASLVILPKDVVLAADELAAQIGQQGISTLFLTTPLFSHLVGEVPQAFHSVKNLLFGGSAAEPKWLRVVLEQGPPERLLHMYGPTESTTFSTWHLVSEVANDARTIPIGKAVANTETYILDRYLQPVPVGVPGELYIGGNGLARGYLNYPGLTAEKFIPHPFSQRPGERLYRTGDLTRYLSDGNIEFLGRTDERVKVRGFRVELGEIEAALGGHASVRQAVVVARHEAYGRHSLVAYVVPAEKSSVTPSELRTYLGVRLPDYMIPSAIVLLEELPLTPNGKVDRRALPDPSQEESTLRKWPTSWRRRNKRR